MAGEFEHGQTSLQAGAVEGAGQFAAGAGRHGDFGG
jgi:enoyl-CoA hydratase